MTIRRFLGKENYQKGFAQYNAIMLTRILTDNPGKLFTQNFDKPLVSTIKDLLREGKDLSVQQILRETLDYFEAEKLKTNDTLTPLVEMWRKEKSKTARIYGNYAVSAGLWTSMDEPADHGVQNTPRGYNQYQSNPRSSHRPKGLPPPDELAARIEEAKTTARLLLQTIQSTPRSELLTNELVKEFADRAQSAHRSVQHYMSSENPPPDEDTMLTLIETNDQLNIAMSRHQRALLEARKALGLGTPSPQPQSQPNQPMFPAQPQPPQQQPVQSGYGPYSQNMPSGYGRGQPLSQGGRSPPGSPPRQDSDYRPPPGPPPAAKGAVRSPDYVYNSSAAGGNPPSSLPPTNSTQAAAYGVAENPFSDTAAQPPLQPPKSYNLFDDAYPGRPTPPPQSNYPQPSQTSGGYSEPQRPVPFAGTESYMHRQESAMNNLTMHGASPPPDRQQTESPTGAMDDVNGVQNRMDNLRV